MRKLFILLTACILCVACGPKPVEEQEPEPNIVLWGAHVDSLYYILYDNYTAEVTYEVDNDRANYQSLQGEITIPTAIEYNSKTYLVRGISHRAFMYCFGLTNVIVSDSIKHKSTSAFDVCVNLKEPIYNSHMFMYLPSDYSGAYIIPNGIETIAEGAFRFCDQVTEVTIPKGVKHIERDAFSGCKSLTSVTIPEGVVKIGCWAFAMCDNLTSITIPNSVEKIDVFAFYSNENLKEVTIPKKFKKHLNDFFENPGNLQITYTE